MKKDILSFVSGISHQECLDIHRKDTKMVLEVATPEEKLFCPCCKRHNVVHTGGVRRHFRSVPLGSRPCELEMFVGRLKCRSCGAWQQEEIDFAIGKRRHTKFFANMVIDLSRFATISDIAWFLDCSWDVVRNIQMDFLQREYGNPDLSNLTYISIDEFLTLKLFAMHDKRVRI